jgi:hypothetical protein
MDLKTKQKYFDRFLVDWGSKFRMVPSILKYLTSYPEIEDKFKDFFPLELGNINNLQLEWVSLVAQFDNSLETSFFRNFWVPIKKDSYDYFIDLSSGTYSIFNATYFSFEPFGWLKEYLCHDVSKLFQSFEDKSIDIDEELEFNLIDYCNDLGDLQVKHRELGLKGKILPPSISPFKFFNNSTFSVNIDGNKLSMTGVTPLVISLLPHETEIEIIDFTVDLENRVNKYQRKVNTLKTFLFLISGDDYSVIYSLEILILSLESGSIKWDNDKLEIIYSDTNVLNQIQTKLCDYMQYID